MAFRPIVGEICSSWAQQITKLLLMFSVSQPLESHVHGFHCFQEDCVGDDWMGTGSCRCHISASVARIATACFALMKKVPNSALKVENMTALVTFVVL